MLDVGMIRIEDLNDFPKQIEIYGEPVPDAELVASIKDVGVLTPLLITKYEEKLVVISGHRRLYGARAAGLESVPYIFREYENYDEMELDFLVCNIQREKTTAIRVNEFKRYKQILCQLGKLRKSKSTYSDTIFANEHFSRILEDTNLGEYIDPSEALNSVDVLKKITGYTKYEQEYLNILYNDDWRASKLNELRALGLSREADDIVNSQFDSLRSQYESGELTLNKAVTQIRELFTEVKGKLLTARERKNKKKTEAAPKKTKTEPAPVKPLLTPVSIAVHVASEKFHEPTSSAIFYDSHDGVEIGTAVTGSEPTGLAARIDGKVYIVDVKLLAEFIKSQI